MKTYSTYSNIPQTQETIVVYEQEWLQMQKKQSSRPSNKTLILAVLVFLILAISFKFISSQIQVQKQLGKNAQPIDPPVDPSIDPPFHPSPDLPIDPPIDLPYNNMIQHNYEIIEKIKRSEKSFECIKISPLFHNFQGQTLYFPTDYGLFIQSCLLTQNYLWSATRQNLQRWNMDRDVTEWALQRLNSNEKMLYYRPGIHNIAEVALLRSLIGPKGEIVILDDTQLKNCLGNTLDIYGSNSNIRYDSIASIKTLTNFTVVIADISLFTISKEKLEQKINPSSKNLIISNNKYILALFRQFRITQFMLMKRDCGIGYFSQIISEKGFYDIRKNGLLQPNNNTKLHFGPTNLLSYLQKEYKKKKDEQITKIQTKIANYRQMQRKCLNLKSERKQKDIYFSIYGRKLSNVSLQEIEDWQGKRQAVEWIRAKIKQRNGSQNTYYEMNHHFNLVAIIEIAVLAKDSLLYVVCRAIECERIKQQKGLNSIDNIKLLGQQSLQYARGSDFLITDNQTLSETCLQMNYSQKGKMLTYFTQTRNQSIKALRRIYVRHQLKQVVMAQSRQECLGFEYLHYYWNSDEPQGFYEAKASNYVVYAFWSGSPKKLTIRKRLLVQQLTNIDVEAKIISTETFLYFQVPECPIHPAYFLLTSIHKSDYVRFYLMHLYGGAYCDVKHTHFAWRPFFEHSEKDPEHYASGYGEVAPIDVACFNGPQQPDCGQIRRHYAKMIGNGYYLFKKDSPLTRGWFKAATQNLSNKLEDLKKNPPQVPREHYGGRFHLADGSYFISRYPFRWAEVASEHLAREQYAYLDKISILMPYVNIIDYRSQRNIDDQK